MPAAAMIGSSVLSGVMGNKAAKGQERAANNQIAESGRQFDIARADTAPYREVGQSALFRLSDMLGMDRAAPVAPNREDFETAAPGGWGRLARQNPGVSFDQAGYDAALNKYNQDLSAFNNRKTGAAAIELSPGYNFRLSAGQTALERAQAAGHITGGRRIKEAMRYGQDYASGEAGNYADQLFRLSGLGGQGVSMSANAGANATNQINSAYATAGNAASMRASSINNAVQGGINNYMTWDMYNKINPLTPMTTAMR